MTLLPKSARLTVRDHCVRLPFMRVKPLVLFVASLVACGAQAAQAASTTGTAPVLASATFDLEMLKSRGINPKVAEFFSQAPRFTAGTRRIDLQVNGSKRGSVDARFDDEGQLCFDQALLDRANLKVPEDRYKTGADCYDFAAAYPQTEVELRPGREQVSLLVSSDALRPLSEDMGVYHSGGTGGLFNYEVLGQSSEFSGQKRNYYSANTELGFNAGDWIVRSRQSMSVQEENRNFQSLYTYAQKTFVPYKSTLQAGQINISNSVFQGAAITGLQVVPDAALQGRGLGGATVEGIAQSAARVEVRQSGALIHTSLVPAGPFKLENVQLLNGATDLDVRVIEANGAQRSFTVPAASLSQVTVSAPGYSMAAGKVRTFEADEMQSPMVVTGTGGWALGANSTLSTGLMASDNGYQAGAWTLDSRVLPTTTLSLRNTLSNASEEGVKGAQASASVTTNLTKTISAGFSVTRQTAGYRDLLDTTRLQTHDYVDGLSRDQYGFSLGWSHELLGSVSAGYSASSTFGGRSTRRLNASWGKSFKYASVNFNVERNVGGKDYDEDDLDLYGNRLVNDDGNAMYLSINVPLGNNRNVRSYANKRDGKTRFGSTFSDSSSKLASYNLSAERNQENKQQDFSGDVSFTPRYAQVGLGYSRSGEDSTSYRGQLRGGVALHENGVTLSPYHLKDTFAVAKVGDVSGVKLNTPSGPVWTDPWGNAVIPQMNAYSSTRVEIDTKSLPRNVDVQNGFKGVSAGRGSVSSLDFPVLKSRRVMLRITDTAGKPIAKGSAVLDATGKFVTAVVDDGKVFLTSEGSLDGGLSVSYGEGKSCAVSFELPDEPDLDVYFETTKATCTAN